MKSKSISAKWMGALFGAYLLLGAGLAQAAGPVCSPTHGPVDIANSSKVTLTANCNPGVEDSIPADGYKWEAAAPAASFVVITAPGGVVLPSTTATAATLTVNLPAEGTRYRVTATPLIGSAGSASPAITVFSGAPSCSLFSVAPTLSESNSPINTVTIASGASAVLMPDCDAATSMDWYTDKPAANTLIPSPSGGMVSPAATTKYYVIGNNAYGSSGSNEVTVIVNVSAAPKSDCTAITPATSSVSPGTATALTATCNNSPAATGYVWKLGIATLSCTRASCTVPAASLAAAGTYTVTVTNNNGQGVGAAATATVMVSATPKSDCTAITPATSSVAPGTATALTATCNNSPAATGYVWNLGTATLSCTGASCTVPAASLAAVGTYTVTVTNNNGQGVGAAATATITVSATPTACPQSIKESLFDFIKTGVTQFPIMQRGQAVAMKFTTDSSGRNGGFLTAYSSGGPEVAKFMNISTNKCDFNYNNLTNGSYCASTKNIAARVNFTLGVAKPLFCKLQPNTTYYVNIRNENANLPTRGVDTCGVGIKCAFAAVLQ